uniref:Opsin-5-like n=1 Tax=Saccoglossus kowalevskii TaxID=10224 RepID=A0ABM0M982_SACKO|nr:PREDICTED: opsin-5-like [Saccoglossus kowalevskii]
MTLNNPSGLSSTADIAVCTYLVVMCILSLFGNVTVLAVKVKNRKQLKTHDYFIINIAVADIGAVTTGYVLAAVSARNHMWYFGSTGCSLVGFSGWFFNCVSMITLSVIAIVRYSIVVGNQGTSIKKNTILIIIAMIWLYSAFWSVAPLVGWDRYALEPHLTSCTIDWTSTQKADIAYIVCIFVWCFAFCLVSIVYSYGGIILTVRQIQQNLFSDSRKSEMNKQRKTTKMFAITTICYLVSWTPYAVMSLISVIQGSAAGIPIALTTLPTLFAKFSCVYNPVVYYITDETFRKSTSQMFGGIRSLFCGNRVTPDVVV